jgi:hypothetical protein
MVKDPGEEGSLPAEPDFILTATIQTSRGAVDNVPCSVYLPRSVMENPHLHFKPTKEQSTDLIVPSFSFEARDEWHGEGQVVVRAKTVWASGPTLKQHSTAIAECSLDGNPWDLEVVEHIPSGEPEETIRHCVFWLTPNRLLEPALLIEQAYTGEVRVKTARELSMTLSSTSLHFRKHFRYEASTRGTLSFDELAAEAAQPFSSDSFEAVVKELDDALLLASVAARQRCLCRGWQLVEGDYSKRYYRSRWIIPSQRRILPQDTLIDYQYMQDFLSQTFPVLGRAEHAPRLRQAMNILLHAHEGGLEPHFMQLFSALETLLGFGRETLGLTKILDDQQWKIFKQDLKGFIRKHPPFDVETRRRDLVLEKLGELNRISLASAFGKFAEFLGNQGLNLSDLWPVTKDQAGVSLSEIRNRLVHGIVQEESNAGPLFTACYHLRWCVERMILAILRWPVEKSLVGTFLRHIIPYNDWRAAQKALSG